MGIFKINNLQLNLTITIAVHLPITYTHLLLTQQKLGHLQSLVVRLMKVRSHTSVNRQQHNNAPSIAKPEPNSEEETNTISGGFLI